MAGRWRCKVGACVFVAMAWLSTVCNAQNEAVLAVMPFEGTGVAVEDAEALTRRVYEELLSRHRFTLIEHSQASEWMKETAYRQETCSGEACAQRLGRALRADHVLAGTVTRRDGRWQITAVIVNLTDGSTTPVNSVEVEGDIQQMIDRAPPVLATKVVIASFGDPDALDSPIIQPVPGSLRDRTGPVETKAVPHTGLAIYSGYFNYSGSARRKGGGRVTYSGEAYPSYGAEYQWQLTTPWTLGAFYQLAAGGGPRGQLGDFNDYTSAGLGGFEVRRWYERWYWGINLGYATTCFYTGHVDRRHPDNQCFHGAALGGTAGYSWSNGWFIGTSVSQAELAANVPKSQPTAPKFSSTTESDWWLNAGYRVSW